MKQLLPQMLVLSLVLFSCKTNKKDPCYLEHKRIETELTIQGMDISHFQNNIKWDEIKKDGVNFVYIKASQSTHFKDPRFKQNRTAAKSQCIYNGAYHFYVTGKDPIKQAENFIAAIGQLEPGDLPPVLDLEELGIKTAVDKQTYQKNTLSWLKVIAEHFGVAPIIYSNTSFANKYLNNPDFAKYQLWVAEYTKAKSPKIPDTWINKGWTIWQRTDSKKLEGIKKVDYDLFHGDAKAFRKLLKK